MFKKFSIFIFIISLIPLYGFTYNNYCVMDSGDKIHIKVFGRFTDSPKILVNGRYTVWKEKSYTEIRENSDGLSTTVVIYKNKGYTYTFEHFLPSDSEVLFIENKWGKRDRGVCTADRL